MAGSRRNEGPLAPYVVAVLVALAVAACALFPVAQSLLGAAPVGEGPAQQQAEVLEYVAPQVDAPAPEPDPVTIDLMMIGDILGHRSVWESGQEADGSLNYDHFFADIKPDIEASDIAIVNQETILGGTELGLSGYPVFNSPQEFGDAEAAAGFDVVLHATNHAVDQGKTGLLNTIHFWESKHPEVTYLGISETQEHYDQIYVYEKDGFRVAILNYTYDTNGIPLPEGMPWAVNLFDHDKVVSDVSRAREMADIVVVCPHWGTEYQLYPDEFQTDWARTFLDMGVDVVIGGHPHVIEPVEVMEREDGHRMVVFWSVGNFVSTSPGCENMIGGLAKVRLVKDGDAAWVSSYSFTPTVTQRNPGYHGITAFKLPTYTEEQAAANGIATADPGKGWSRQWCVDFCSQVLGDGFDRESCVLEGELPAPEGADEELAAAA